MPWTPLTPNVKRAADKLNKAKKSARPRCWAHKRKTLARQHKLGFFARVKFYLRTSK